MASSSGASLLLLLALFGDVAESAPPLCKTIISQSSCIFMECSTWRGKTNCSHLSHYCVCQPGYCADEDGTCRPDPRRPEECDVDSKGDWCFTNLLMGCGGGADDTRECDFWNSKCTCSIGSCFNHTSQQCVPHSYNGTRHDDCKRTEGTCSFFPCRKDRGSTECLGGLCFCAEEDENWNGTKCVNSNPGNWSATSGTVSNDKCFQDRHLSGNHTPSPSRGSAVSLSAPDSWPAKPLALKVEEAVRRASSLSIFAALAAVVSAAALGRRRQRRCVPGDAEAPAAGYVDLRGEEQ